MHDLTETEVKLYVPDLDAVAARITAAGALTTPRVFERNVRYDTADDAFAPQGIVLRLRQDNAVRLTYKGPGKLDDGALTRTEIEVTLDNFDHMDLILRHLGFTSTVIYEKYRTTYALGSAEIVLDELPFGHFVEIEATRPAIQDAVQTLALDEHPPLADSYLGLFQRVKRALGLDMRDLTFEAFAGIDVPPDVFVPPGD